MTVLIPETFRQRMLILHGQKKGRAWLDRLPGLLNECAQRWQLTLLAPVAHLSFHYVIQAIRADGTLAMLKACSPTGEFATEAQAMQALAGPALARVLAIDEEQEVMLLERLVPGTVLAELVPEQDERATSILVETMRNLWRPAPTEHGFPTVERWGKGFERLHAHYPDGYGPFPRKLVDTAERLFGELSTSAPEHLLLHGDLHHENILRTDDGWRAIDAKGVVGDPGYELGLLFYNPMPLIFTVPNLRALLARRVDQLATELSMERERVRGWGLAQSMLSAWWSVEDGQLEPPRKVIACAEIMAEL